MIARRCVVIERRKEACTTGAAETVLEPAFAKLHSASLKR